MDNTTFDIIAMAKSVEAGIKRKRVARILGVSRSPLSVSLAGAGWPRSSCWAAPRFWCVV